MIMRVKAIFCVAGPVGRGAVQEAILRTENGEEVYTIGSDFDQYNIGVYQGDKSVVLTSAAKRYSDAAYNMIMSISSDNFREAKKYI